VGPLKSLREAVREYICMTVRTPIIIMKFRMNNNYTASLSGMAMLARYAPPIHALLTRLANNGRGHKQVVSMLVDSLLVVLSLWGAYSLRHGVAYLAFEHNWYLYILLPIASVAIFSVLGVYRWVIRSTNQRLFKQLLKGSVLSGLALLIAFFLLPPNGWNPRSLFVIFTLLLFVSTSGMRMFWKTLFDSGKHGEPIAVYGAGATGQQLVNLLTVDSQYRPVMFIDDDPKKSGTTLFGLPIVNGDSAKLEAKLSKADASKIVLAMPSLPAVDYHRKIQELSALEIPVLTLPNISELMSGTAKVDDIRDVSIGDILGRSEVPPDLQLMARRITGKTVLVTGGGGSIGSELCRQIMKLSPKHLIALENCEANLYYLTEELSEQSADSTSHKGPRFTPFLCSVLDKQQVDKLMAKFKVNTVVHAAAYKHVPIVEAQPDQGVAVNIFGTKTVLESAIRNGVDDFVLISTDKAVRPTNAMGATKRLAELVLQARAAENVSTRISMVRFGNVLGSSGSVVPKFKKQILDGGPITLTHSDVTRYFMTIPEAAQLVLQASAIAQGGEVFVLDMGEPVRIEELAITMIRLYGKKLKRDTGNPTDIDIVVQGLRPGEKLYEELFISNEHRPTDVHKISAANELWLSTDQLDPFLLKLKRFADKQDAKALRSILLEIAFLDEESKSQLEVNYDHLHPLPPTSRGKRAEDQDFLHAIKRT
jgi:FlaA1/EpsC-like NDP-sugar epimerase